MTLFNRGRAVFGGLTVLGSMLVAVLVAPSATFYTGTVGTFVATSTASVQTLNVTSTSALKGAVTLSSTLAVPNALSTLSSLSVTGTTAVGGAISAYGGITGSSLVATSSLAIASGKAAILFTSATASLDFPSISNGTCSSLTMSVPGATVGTTSPNAVFVGYDPELKSGYATHTRFGAWASGVDTVTVEGCAGTSTAMVDPPAFVFRSVVANFNP